MKVVHATWGVVDTKMSEGSPLESLTLLKIRPFTKFSKHLGLSIVDSFLRVFFGKTIKIDFCENIIFLTSCDEMRRLLLEPFLTFSFSLFSFILSWSAWTSFGEKDFSVNLSPWKVKEIFVGKAIM